MKKLVFLSVILSVVSCESSSQKNSEEDEKNPIANYKEYFSPTAIDGKSRFYLFDETTVYDDRDAINSKALRSIRKENDSTLIAVEYTQYADTIVRTDSTVMVMRENGIYNKASFINGGEDWLELNLNHALAIPWKWKRDRVVNFGWSATRDSIEMQLKSKRTFAGFNEKKLEQFGKVKLAIREDDQLRITGKKEATSRAILWDVPGFGLYRYEIIADGYSYVMEFEKELSESEYNELMGRYNTKRM